MCRGRDASCCRVAALTPAPAHTANVARTQGWAVLPAPASTPVAPSAVQQYSHSAHGSARSSVEEDGFRPLPAPLLRAETALPQPRLRIVTPSHALGQPALFPWLAGCLLVPRLALPRARSAPLFAPFPLSLETLALSPLALCARRRFPLFRTCSFSPIEISLLVSTIFGGKRLFISGKPFPLSPQSCGSGRQPGGGWHLLLRVKTAEDADLWQVGFPRWSSSDCFLQCNNVPSRTYAASHEGSFVVSLIQPCWCCPGARRGRL